MKIAAVLFFIMFSMQCADVRAQGLLGQRYIGIYFSKLKVDEEVVEGFDDTVATGYGVKARYPFHNNFDAILEISKSTLEASNDFVVSENNQTYISVNGLAHLLPGKRFDPFFSAGIASISTEMETKYMGYKLFDDDESNIGYLVSTGVEINLGVYAAVTPSFSYATVDGEDGTAINLAFIFWIHGHLGLSLIVSAPVDFNEIGSAGNIGMRF